MANSHDSNDAYVRGSQEISEQESTFDAFVGLSKWGSLIIAASLLFLTIWFQPGGAFGFRDQLQDTLAFLTVEPNLARSQILKAAARQFVEGDVQHWWLPQTGAGVRTMISDDVVWLAYAIDQYVSTTGDSRIGVNAVRGVNSGVVTNPDQTLLI